MISDFQVERRELAFKGGSFVVMGLTFESFTTIVRTHLPDLEAVFELITSNAELQDGDLMKLAIALLNDAPGFAANLIALAAGEPDQAPAVLAMPFDVQLVALLAVGELTFSETGGVKKLVPAVMGLLGATGLKDKATAMMTKVKAP